MSGQSIPIERRRDGNFPPYMDILTTQIIESEGNIVSSAPAGTKVVLRRAASEGTIEITNGQWTDIDGFAVDGGDAGMFADDGKTIEIQEDGYYAINFNIAVGRTAGTSRLRVRILKNGTDVVAFEELSTTTGSAGDKPVACGNEVYLVKGDELVGQAGCSLSNTSQATSQDYNAGVFAAFKVSV